MRNSNESIRRKNPDCGDEAQRRIKELEFCERRIVWRKETAQGKVEEDRKGVEGYNWCLCPTFKLRKSE